MTTKPKTQAIPPEFRKPKPPPRQLTIHMPEIVAAFIDEVAGATGESRNRVIVEALHLARLSAETSDSALMRRWREARP